MSDHQSSPINEVGRQTLWRPSPFKICTSFEGDLQSEGHLRAEAYSYLRAVKSEDYHALLFGLLQREIAYCKEKNDPLTQNDLAQRFPDNPNLVNALFDQALPLDIVAERLHHYECLARIDSGPIGGVYKVRDLTTNQLRIVRHISPFFLNSSSSSERRGSKEMGHLFHKHIACPVELVEHSGAVFIVMEYCPGITLANLVAQNHPIPFPVVCEILRQASCGLANIHKHKETHEDIRPANLLVEFQGQNAGLVKLGGLASGLIRERQGRYALWPDSLLLNAPTYFAPELFSGRKAPDSRSDVFALGMVLHSALAGNKNISTLPSDSTPAQRNRPTPLATLRPDCPRELEALILHMTAEEPAERIASAGEVVDRLEKFADAEMLITWIKGIGPVGDSKAASPLEKSAPATKHKIAPDPARISQPVSQEANPPLSTGPNPKSPPAKRSRLVELVKRKKRVFLGVSVVLLFGLGAWLFFNRGVIGPDPDPEMQEAIAILTELPGPNGDWWFDEVPWFTPNVRAELAHRLSRSDPAFDREQILHLTQKLRTYPDFQSIAELEGIVHKVIQTLPHEEGLVVRQILEVKPQTLTVADLKSEYAEITQDLDPTKLHSPASWHLRANLLHASSNPKEAITAYEQALELYREPSNESIRGLRALCAADYARLLATYERNYKKANVYSRLCADDAQTTALNVDSLCQMADALRKLGQYPEAIQMLTAAEQLMKSQSAVLADHALYAVIHESFAWTALDTWQLTKALEQFKKAREIRVHHRSGGNPRSWRFILWIGQGEAMIAHFQGDQHQAEEKYRTLLGEIDSALKGGFVLNLPKQQRAELAARRPNLYERLGDCYLFGAGIDHAKACQAFEQALQAMEDSSFDSKKLWPHILALKYKYGMALSLAGERDAAKQMFQETEMERNERESNASEGQSGIYQSIRVTSRSLIQLADGSEAERQEAIKDLQQYYSTASTHVTRSNINLLMLTSEELLKPTVLKPRDSQKVVRRFNSLIDVLRSADSERSLSTYLHRYCENAQRTLLSGSATGVNPAKPNLNAQISAVLTESKARDSQVGRGLTRGTIQYDEKGKPVSSRLHVLSIGVSEYKYHNELKLSYADDDADALFNAYGRLCKNGANNDGTQALFQRGQFRKLTNEEATKPTIIDAIDQLAQSATKNDLVIVSLSGHGTVDDSGNFFFLPHDYRGQSLRASAIWDQELREMLTRKKSNAILVLDACHSGAATTTGTKSASTQELRNALQRFTSAQKGLIILAASLSTQKAFEDQKLGHGVLTLALLEALTGQYNAQALTTLKDRNKTLPQLPQPQDESGLITLADIQYYIGLRVMGLTNGKQRATMNRLGGDLSMRDIPIRFASKPSTP